MIRALAGLLGVALLVGCSDAASSGKRPSIAPEDIVSGYAFLQPETQALQEDAFANPAFLWVDQGQVLFEAGETPCASCHSGDDQDLVGASASYPAIDEQSGELINIEARINACRERHQNKPPLEYESRELLSLTAYVGSQSIGLPHTPQALSEATQVFFERGEDYFYTRRGQFNLSCSSCHDASWGKKLRGDTISQGHPNGFPAYRLEWQALGSLHRRLRDCDTGVRAEPLEFGDPTYTAVEYYLALRSRNLTIETPAVRR